VDQVIKNIPHCKETEISSLPSQQLANGVHPEPDELFFVQFYDLLTAHLRVILVNDNLTHNSFFVYVYAKSLHVSSIHVLIIRRINCINTTSGTCHSV